MARDIPDWYKPGMQVRVAYDITKKLGKTYYVVGKILPARHYRGRLVTSTPSFDQPDFKLSMVKAPGGGRFMGATFDSEYGFGDEEVEQFFEGAADYIRWTLRGTTKRLY
jgi:hypothetical protein